MLIHLMLLHMHQLMVNPHEYLVVIQVHQLLFYIKHRYPNSKMVFEQVDLIFLNYFPLNHLNQISPKISHPILVYFPMNDNIIYIQMNKVIDPIVPLHENVNNPVDQKNVFHVAIVLSINFVSATLISRVAFPDLLFRRNF
jgi:hypothetical protein